MDINYIRSGNHYIPDPTLPEEIRPIGRWGRMHREYLREHKPIQYNCLLLSGKLWTYLADLNQQAQDLHQQLDAVVQQSGRRAMDVTRRGPARFGHHHAAGCGCGYRVI